MSLILKNELSQHFPKIGSHEYQQEEFEIAPGLICTVRYESKVREVADKFLRRKTTIGQLKKAVRGT